MPGKANKPAGTSQKKTQVLKARAAIHRRKAAGEVLSYDEIEKEAGVSAGSVLAALAAEEAVAEALAGAVKIEDIALTGSAQAKFDAKLRAFQKAYKAQLDAEYQAKLTAAVNKWAETYRIPTYLKEIETVRKMLEFKMRHGGVMTRADFRQVLSCLHPDAHASLTPEKMAGAFRIMKEREDMIVMDMLSPKLGSIFDMPFVKDDILNRGRREKPKS